MKTGHKMRREDIKMGLRHTGRISPVICGYFITLDLGRYYLCYGDAANRREISSPGIGALFALAAVEGDR